MDKYKMSLWFYNKENYVDVDSVVKDMVKLGINLAMSYPYDPDSTDKVKFESFLDKCHEKGMKIIISDVRTRYNTLYETDEETFKKGVEDAVKDFGSHPATYGFLVGDEPVKETWESSIKAFNIVKEAAPDLTHLINFYPCFWNGFDKLLGCSHEEYSDRLDDYMKKTGSTIMAYDYYGHCGYVDKIKWIDIYFRNLNMFRSVAEKNNAELFTSLLSVGHWMYRCPNEDDFRWQISTSVAHGVVGIMWFFIFQTGMYNENYRTAPVDVFGERSETFEWLSRQNRIFMQRTAQKLNDFKFEKVEHWLLQYGNTPSFTGSGVLKEIKAVENPKPLAVSYFKGENDEDCIGVTNLSQDEPTSFNLVFEGEFEKYNGACRLAPGQIRIYTKEETM